MRPRELLLVLLLTLALTPLGLLAQDPSPWTVHTIRGEQLAGELRLGADGQLHFRGDSGERTLALDELLRLEHSAVSGQAQNVRRRIWLRSGVELPVSTVSGAGRELTAGVAFASEPLSMNLHFIAAMRVSEEPVDTDFEEQLSEPGESVDYLYILNEGKTARMSVAVLGFESDSLTIELSGQEREVRWELIYGVIFGRDSGAVPDRQPKPRVSLVLRQGARLPPD